MPVWHLIWWTGFIIYEVSFIYVTSIKISPVLNYICYYALNISLFYFNAHIILVYAFSTTKIYFRLISGVALEIITYLAIKYLLDFIMAEHHDSSRGQLVYICKFIIPNTYRCVYFIGFSTLYWAVRRAGRFREQAEKTETNRLKLLVEKTEIEKNLSELDNAYLQHQINPHLLFNTLNFIYSSCSPYTEKAAECVELLADIMHYSLEAVGEDGKTALKMEIKQIKNLVRMNRLLCDYKLYFLFKINGKPGDNRIIPLILITLIENIFKHGYLKEKQQPARCLIHISEQKQLTLEIWNLKKAESKYKRIKKIGIVNVYKRLEHSYKGRFKLDIQDKPHSYYLNLKMQL